MHQTHGTGAGSPPGKKEKGGVIVTENTRVYSKSQNMPAEILFSLQLTRTVQKGLAPHVLVIYINNFHSRPCHTIN